jgi:hypothetical protein
VANSTPIVGYEALGREPFMYLLSRLVLPTPASPTSTILYRKSYSSCPAI